MNVAGVIAEYNPFHNGHAYQLRQIRSRTGADFILVAMSGNFVQRGEPALLDKQTRAKMALAGGADLVLELPAVYATASAETFARGGVSLLSAAGVVDTLCFGAETDDLSLMQQVAFVLSSEPPAFRADLKEALRKNPFYPAAREEALVTYFSSHPARENDLSPSPDPDALHEMLSRPNNILALEYLKALFTPSSFAAKASLAVGGTKQTAASSLRPLLIPRIGDDERQSIPTSRFPAASAVRRMLQNPDYPLTHLPSNSGPDPDSEGGGSAAGPKAIPSFDLPSLFDVLPQSSIEILSSYQKSHRLLCADDLSPLLLYRLLLMRDSGYGDFCDVGPYLSQRIRRHLSEYQHFTQFCGLLKTKETTYSRISRALLHIVLDIKTTDFSADISSAQSREGGSDRALLSVPYLRVLDFKPNALPLLHEMKQKASLPILHKEKDADRLTGDALRVWKKEQFADALYRQMSRTDFLP